MTATATLAAPIAAPRPPVNKWLVTVSITFGTLMGAIDASIVNVAIPHIRGTVGATVEEITWISTGFAMANVLIMPLTAFLGRLFGPKRVYMASLVLFLFGSVLCGLARSLTGLIIFRIIQGFGAGALQPTEQAILRQTFSPKEQGMAMAVFALAIMVGPAVGPTLGGYIVDNYAWPWIFYINIPVGALGLFMVYSFVHEPDDIRAANRAQAEKMRANMDWAGIVLMVVGLATLQYVLEEGQRNDWFQSRLIVGLSMLSAVALVAWVIRELTAPVPAVDFRLFKDPAFLSGTLVGSIMFAMLLSLTFLLPLFMQELLGFTAVQSGLDLMPRTLVMMVCIPIVGRLYNRLPARILCAAGVLTFIVSAYMMSKYNLQTTSGGVVAALLVQGLAFSALMVPLNTLALASIPRHKLTDATGLNSLLRQIGASVGLAIFANALQRQTVRSISAVASHMTAVDPAVQQRLAMMKGAFMGQGLDPVTASQMSIATMGGIAARQGSVLAFEYIFFLAGVCFFLVLPLVYFLKTPDGVETGKQAEPIHVEA
jgi:DHA2 family multidrug resistance protein